MTIYQMLSIIGFPGITISLITLLGKKLKKNTEDTNAIKLGVQAILRAQLIADWNKYCGKGYAPVYARDNFENMWTQYHSLGANGVMDDIHDKFLALPTSPPDEAPLSQRRYPCEE